MRYREREEGEREMQGSVAVWYYEGRAAAGQYGSVVLWDSDCAMLGVRGAGWFTGKQRIIQPEHYPSLSCPPFIFCKQREVSYLTGPLAPLSCKQREVSYLTRPTAPSLLQAAQGLVRDRAHPPARQEGQGGGQGHAGGQPLAPGEDAALNCGVYLVPGEDAALS